VKHTNLYKGPPSEKLRVLWMASWPSDWQNTTHTEIVPETFLYIFIINYIIHHVIIL